MYLNFFIVDIFFNSYYIGSEVSEVSQRMDLCLQFLFFYTLEENHLHTAWELLLLLAASLNDEVWRQQKQQFSEQVNAEPQNIPVGNELHASDEEGSQLYSSRKREHPKLSDRNVSHPHSLRQEPRVEADSNLS